MGRKTGLSQISDFSKVRKSAVALNLFYDKSWKSILIQRPIYNGHHSGQVCFPGGSSEPQDKELLQTALRECEEETGIRKDQFQLLGKLTPVYIPVSNFIVKPFVFLLDEPPTFYPDQREVDEILIFDIVKELKNIEIHYTDVMIATQSKLSNVPFFPIQSKVVWGATALILGEMREVLKRINA